MSKLSDVVKNDAAKKAVHEKLVAKVNNIDTSEFVLKTKYQTDKTKLEKKIDVTDFVKKTKLTELGKEIPDISSLATKAALTAVKNKIASVSSLVKKKLWHKNQWAKNLLIIIMKKIYTTPEFNTLAADVLMQD